jgi:hypothetical protein
MQNYWGISENVQWKEKSPRIGEGTEKPSVFLKSLKQH